MTTFLVIIVLWLVLHCILSSFGRRPPVRGHVPMPVPRIAATRSAPAPGGPPDPSLASLRAVAVRSRPHRRS
jgi:hypothetical protein